MNVHRDYKTTETWESFFFAITTKKKEKRNSNAMAAWHLFCEIRWKSENTIYVWWYSRSSGNISPDRENERRRKNANKKMKRNQPAEMKCEFDLRAASLIKKYHKKLNAFESSSTHQLSPSLKMRVWPLVFQADFGRRCFIFVSLHRTLNLYTTSSYMTGLDWLGLCIMCECVLFIRPFLLTVVVSIGLI